MCCEERSDLDFFQGEVCSSEDSGLAEQGACVKTRVVRRNRTDHDEGLERSLEGDGGRTHAARAAEVRVVGAGCHSHNALGLGHLPAQEVILVLPRALTETE